MISSGNGIQELLFVVSGLKVVTYLNGMQLIINNGNNDHGIGFSEIELTK